MIGAIVRHRTSRHRLRMLAIAIVCGAWCGTAVMAQGAASAPGTEDIESDPIKCWWKTDRSAVQIGEPFGLLLTCGVIETSRIRVVVDPIRLDPMAIELTPFDVLGGSRHRDVEAPPWRYFQYSYTVRLLGDEFFGQDVDIPSIQLTYRVQTVNGDSGGTQGRDQLYVLPLLPVRVLSLVPRTATDIRDVSPETFADIDARLFRSTGELAAAGVFFAFAVVLAGIALVRMVGRSRRVPAGARPLGSDAMLRGCVRETGRLKSEVARQGWTPELIGRALAVFRVVGAVALGRPVTQTLVEEDVPEREGQLVLRRGMVRSKRALISAPTTATAIDAQLANSNGRRVDPRTQAMLQDLGESLRVFGAVQYSRNGHVDAAALDAALDRGESAIRRWRATTMRSLRAIDMLTRAAAGLRGTMWSR